MSLPMMSKDLAQDACSVVLFDEDISHKLNEDQLGRKGIGLIEMTRLGLSVPPGFVIPASVGQAACMHAKSTGHFSRSFQENIITRLNHIGKASDVVFGNPERPLIVSVRSGARVSMPGMLDSILNIGMNKEICNAMRARNVIFAEDSYQRVVQSYRRIVGETLPEDPMAQLWGALRAVVQSWWSQRAVSWRRIHDIPDEPGTAVIVQTMVFGNSGHNAATGVFFTRNPATGEKKLFGEFLSDCQGEDIVSGVQTPAPLTHIQRQQSDARSLEEAMPSVYQELLHWGHILEHYYRDMQDIEFTVQQGVPWILQTRSGKRTAHAAFKIALDMVAEGISTKEEVLSRIDPHCLGQFFHASLRDPNTEGKIGKGIPASPGAACGYAVFSTDTCLERVASGQPAILIREETSPEDIQGMAAAEGILTGRGGATSHAAVVARGLGKPCVTGIATLSLSVEGALLGNTLVKEGDPITVDGYGGAVFIGHKPLMPGIPTRAFWDVMSWTDKVKRMRVYANAETPNDIAAALQFGAQGVGLCRTEHMFLESKRSLAIQKMILAQSSQERVRSIEEIFPLQRSDFCSLFAEMKGLPIVVRLLDPPLHEFLPKTESEISKLSDALSLPIPKLLNRIDSLKEMNPMLGHRGCRLGITIPELYDMQVRAIAEAVLVSQEKGYKVHCEIMVPLVAFLREFVLLKERILRIWENTGIGRPCSVGAMIELPRAALRAAELASEADFLSFGTNDLTQTALGLSRDDTGEIIAAYKKQDIMKVDPFISLDQSGVGELISLACSRARLANPQIRLGICGEHGGDPASIGFFEHLGLDYVSCSPYRVPTARLAAAQAVLKDA